ncbi:MAG: DNA polymerase III subunit alpha, partial [Hydrogenobacter sp.]
FYLMDKTGIAEAVAFPDIYESNKEILKEDALVVLKCDVEHEEEYEDTKLIVREVYKPEEFIKGESMYLTLVFTRELSDEELTKLKNCLTKHSNQEGKELILDLRINGYRTLLQADPSIKVLPSAELLEELKKLDIKLIV